MKTKEFLTNEFCNTVVLNNNKQEDSHIQIKTTGTINKSSRCCETQKTCLLTSITLKSIYNSRTSGWACHSNIDSATACTLQKKLKLWICLGIQSLLTVLFHKCFVFSTIHMPLVCMLMAVSFACLYSENVFYSAQLTSHYGNIFCWSSSENGHPWEAALTLAMSEISILTPLTGQLQQRSDWNTCL